MYKSRLQSDFDRWVKRGLISADTAQRLLADVESRQRPFRLSEILAILAAVLIGASVILLIAANWEEIPRLARLAMIFGLLLASNLAAGVMLARGRSGPGNAALVFSCLVFGGGIALVGQMYHLSGDAGSAALLWLAVTLAAAVAFRAAVLAHAAVLLAWFHYAAILTEPAPGLLSNPLVVPPVMAVILLIIMRATDARRAGHGVCLYLLAWLARIYVEWSDPATSLAIAACGAALFFLLSVRASPAARSLSGEGPWPAFYALLTAFMGLVFFHADMNDGGWQQQALAGTLVLALSIGALAVAGRDFGLIRRLTYLAFAAETLFLSYETVGTMLGTSGFFLLGGFVVAAIAFVVTRLERRFSPAGGRGGR